MLQILGLMIGLLPQPNIAALEQSLLRPVKSSPPASVRQGEMEILLTKQWVEANETTVEAKSEEICRLAFKVNVYDIGDQMPVPDGITRLTCETKFISKDGSRLLSAEISVGGMITLQSNGVKSLIPWYVVEVAGQQPWAVTNMVSVTEPNLKDLQFVLENQPEGFYKDLRVAATVVMRDRP